MKLNPSYVLLVLSVILVSVAPSQSADLPPNMEQWSNCVGHWINEEERRGGPDASWNKVKSEWTIEVLPGGHFVQTPGKVTKANGKTVQWGEVWGYDPSTKKNFEHWFASDGFQGKNTFHWEGRTLITEGVVISPDGIVTKVRMKESYSPNWKTTTMTGEKLIDGKWVVTRKVKGKRLE